MDPSLKDKTLENLTKAESVLVAVSPKTGLDGLAAGLGLYLSLLKLGKNTSIVAKSPSVGDAQQLYGVDKIGKSAGSKNLVVNVAGAVENVDKITYSLVGDDLKIVIHAFPGAESVTQEQISYEQTPSKPNLIFAIGYINPEELKQEITHEQNVDSEVWLININKQDVGQIFAQVNIFDPNASSLSEIAAQLSADLALPIDEDIAYNFYKGISEATSNFSPSQASPASFEIASWLIKFGAGRASFAQKPPPVQVQSQPRTVQPPFTQRPQQPQSAPSHLSQSQAAGRPFQNYVSDIDQFPVEDVEQETKDEQNWLKPPKIYQGSKSVDGKE